MELMFDGGTISAPGTEPSAAHLRASRACEDLVYAGFWFADYGRRAAVVDLFAEGGGWDLGGVKLEGVEAMRSHIERRDAEAVATGWRIAHLVSSYHFELLELNHARAEYFTTVHVLSKPTDLALLPYSIAKCTDEFIRNDSGRWLFKYRITEFLATRTE